VPEIDDQPGQPGADRLEQRLVDVAVADARQAQYVLARLLLDDVDDVVDR
jgi:hypothetical protein